MIIEFNVCGWTLPGTGVAHMDAAAIVASGASRGLTIEDIARFTMTTYKAPPSRRYYMGDVMEWVWRIASRLA